MKLFCFASRTLQNVWLGVRARQWAVAKVQDSQMKARITKARRYFVPGSHGLLYCEPTHSFMVPFISKSRADPDAVITNVWPEPWVLPFSIEPLGDPRRQVRMEDAMAHWPILIRKQENGATSVTAALNITGTTVFAPTEIADEDWDMILAELAIKDDYPQDF